MSYTQTFDADSLKPQQMSGFNRKCYRCQSTTHLVGACPFQTQAAVAAQAQTASTEVCFKFNEGNCTFRNCKRQHVCSKCGSPSPRAFCQCTYAITSTTNSNLTSPQALFPPQPPGGYRYQSMASTPYLPANGQDRYAK